MDEIFGGKGKKTPLMTDWLTENNFEQKVIEFFMRVKWVESSLKIKI